MAVPHQVAAAVASPILLMAKKVQAASSAHVRLWRGTYLAAMGAIQGYSLPMPVNHGRSLTCGQNKQYSTEQAPLIKNLQRNGDVCLAAPHQRRASGRDPFAGCMSITLACKEMQSRHEHKSSPWDTQQRAAGWTGRRQLMPRN